MIETNEIGRVIEICAKTTKIAEEEISYRLVKIESDFWLYLLRVCSGEEEAIIIAGNDMASAKSIFDSFVDGKVSPCSANDVFKDIILS